MRPFRYGVVYALTVGAVLTVAMIATVIFFTRM